MQSIQNSFTVNSTHQELWFLDSKYQNNHNFVGIPVFVYLDFFLKNYKNILKEAEEDSFERWNEAITVGAMSNNNDAIRATARPFFLRNLYTNKFVLILMYCFGKNIEGFIAPDSTCQRSNASKPLKSIWVSNRPLSKDRPLRVGSRRIMTEKELIQDKDFTSSYRTTWEKKEGGFCSRTLDAEVQIGA